MQRALAVVAYLGGGTGTAASIVAGAGIAAEASLVGTTAAGIVGLTALPIVIGVASLGALSYGVYKLINLFKGSIKKNMSE